MTAPIENGPPTKAERDFWDRNDPPLPQELEDDFILRTLLCFVEDMKTSKPVSEIIDKHACILTAYMRGRIIEGRNPQNAQ